MAAASVPFSQEFIDRGCRSRSISPAGIQLVKGGLNGANEILECGTSIVILYQFDYREELSQKITVYDAEYASDPEGQKFRIKQGSVQYKNGVLGNISWLNPWAEYRVEIYDYEGESKWPSVAAEVLDIYARKFIDSIENGRD